VRIELKKLADLAIELNPATTDSLVSAVTLITRHGVEVKAHRVERIDGLIVVTRGEVTPVVQMLDPEELVSVKFEIDNPKCVAGGVRPSIEDVRKYMKGKRR
jgi:hypothetical protein